MKSIFIFIVVFLFSLSETYSQNNAIYRYLKILPTEAFDHTVFGISKDEINELTENKSNDFWRIEDISDKKIRIFGGDQSVTLYMYDSKSFPLICIYTENAKSSFLEIWATDPFNRIPIKKDILPKISVNDFFDESDAFSNPEKFSGNISLFLNKNNIIQADLYTWMQAEFNKITIKYEVYIELIDNQFIKIKKIKNN